jgi:hypothetical protein
MPPSEPPPKMPPPVHVALEDVDARRVEAVMCGDGGLIFKRGIVRFDLTPGATLTLLRWGLHGRWAPPRPGRCGASRWPENARVHRAPRLVAAACAAAAGRSARTP